jgi:hypothetical protein
LAAATIVVISVRRWVIVAGHFMVVAVFEQYAARAKRHHHQP